MCLFNSYAFLMHHNGIMNYYGDMRMRTWPRVASNCANTKMSREWTNGVFGCFNDCTSCILAYFIPCYIFGKNAEVVGDSCVLCALSQFVPLLSIWARVSIRGKIREQRGIQGSCISDLICVWLCPLCTLVQEAQEIKPPGGLSMARE